MKKEKTANDYLLEQLFIEAKFAYALIKFGDSLGAEKYSGKVKGLEAIHLYLIDKYKWKLDYVRSLSYEDLRFLLTVEMKNWKLPKDAHAQGL